MEMNKVVGQRHMIERLLIGLLGQGHIARRCSGISKTLAINTLAQAVHGSFRDTVYTGLLPADVVGTMIYNIKQNEFSIRTNFCQFRLADEINRAPAKVQSAL
jgi:MoxR-like ATPase